MSSPRVSIIITTGDFLLMCCFQSYSKFVVVSAFYIRVNTVLLLFNFIIVHFSIFHIFF